MMNDIKLRAHHGMCLQFFRGKGYDKEFTAHMQLVSDSLKENPRIRIITQCDIICSHCPNLQNAECISQDTVYGYDKKVLEFCGIRENSIMTWDKFSTLVQKRIVDVDKKKICSSCEWNYLYNKIAD